MGNGNNGTYEYMIEEWHKNMWKDEDLQFREILFMLHIDKGMSYREISQYFKVSLSTVYMWFKRENLLDKQMKW